MREKAMREIAKMFPIGIEFKPTGEQLIVGYLLPWVKGEKLEWNGIVEKRMYGENFPCEPWKVFSDIESSYHSKMEEKGAIKYTIYAFTTLLRASNSKRVSRRAGKGTWGGQTGPKKIENSATGCIIGQSKMLAYEHSGEADVGHWTMHEFCLSDESAKESGKSNAADLVVCKITKTVKKKPSDGRRAPPQPSADANKFLSPETEVPFANPGVDAFAQPGGVSIVQQSDERRVPPQPLVDANKFLLPENEVPFPNPGVDPFAQSGVVSTVQQSDERHAPLQPDAYKLLPANEVPFANPGIVSILDPYDGGYELPVAQPDVVIMNFKSWIDDGSFASIVRPYCGGYEASVPVPVPADPTVSMKRAAEVDLRNEEDSEKRQKCDGKEFSDAIDELKRLGDMFASNFSDEFSQF